MFDLNEIGQEGIVVQYEDIISMIGFNVARFFHNKNVSEKLDSMSTKDILSSYIKRDDENYARWLNKEFNIFIDPNDMLSSFKAMQPNLLYSYKIFTTAHNEKKNNLYIFSDNYSPIAEQSTKSYGFEGIKYIHGNIVRFLKEHPNFTYLTSSISNIKKCVRMDTPTCLVIVDDYSYISDIYNSKVDQELAKKNNIILRFTGVISAGLI